MAGRCYRLRTSQMFQLFLRARAHDLLSGRPGQKRFKACRAERDAERDRSRIASIESALQETEREPAGLYRRVAFTGFRLAP